MMMVWIAISPRGLSKPAFYRSGSLSVNSPIFIDKCLLPFIQECYADSNYIFWSDLADAHYSGLTSKWPHENTNFITKNPNPPNILQARPIENFWAT